MASALSSNAPVIRNEMKGTNRFKTAILIGGLLGLVVLAFSQARRRMKRA
jgi:hypothetical protein